MRTLWRWITILAIVLAGFGAPPPRALAANLDKTADLVIGQPGFGTSFPNQTGLNARGLSQPGAAVLDRQGNLYVADTTNHRVLVYDAPLSTHEAASVVLGQPDFFTNTLGLGPRRLSFPTGLALDVFGNLYVADGGNNRVLEFEAPFSTNEAANHVIGQPDFTHNQANNGGLSARSLAAPFSVAVDDLDNVYVADSYNNRVLMFSQLASDQPAAEFVLGQPDFITNTANSGGLDANSLNNPIGLTVDAHRKVYVADTDNNRVLEYDPLQTNHQDASRVIGQPGFTTRAANNGGLNASGLYQPLGVAIDAQGDLYVADSFNNRALEYDAPLSTHPAANHVYGQPGFGSSAPNNPSLGADSLVRPIGLSVDASGNFYIADLYNNRVLEYDLPRPHQVPSLSALAPNTLAAGGPDFTLAVNGAGFVAGSVVRWNGANRPTTYLSSIQLRVPISAADVGNGGPFAVTVFTPGPGGGMSNTRNISLYTRAGHDPQADQVLGQPNFGQADFNNLNLLHAGRLFGPVGMALDPHTGRLYMADQSNSRLVSWPNAAALANSQRADLFIGQPNSVSLGDNTGGRSATSLSQPRGVALDATGNLYVADTNNNRVLEYNAPLATGMAASHVFGQGGSFASGAANKGALNANSLNAPAGLALDAAGRLYVADRLNNRVLEYDAPLSSQTANHVIGQPSFVTNTANYNGVSQQGLNDPYGVALDAAGNLYVADAANNRVLEFDLPLTTDASADRVFGQADFTHNGSNRGQANPSNDSLYQPFAVAIDGAGNLYLSDTSNHRVLEFDSPLIDQTADRVFGQADFTHGAANRGQPNPSASSLFQPLDLALDGQDNLFVADQDNNRVLEYDGPAVKLTLPLLMR